jgi:aryl-alcohol dehydrogenase-like predicted oxidoreductase
MKVGHVPGVNKPISRLVQGTASFSGNDPGPFFNLLDTALEHGYNTFDSAFVYGPDKEGILGKWINDRGVREKVVILAKGAHHDGTRQKVTPEDIDSDMRESMNRMQTDYFDLYVLHRDDPSVPVGPIVEALNEHVRAGRIHAFGGSNWSHDRIQEANQYALEHSLIPFAVSSPNFSLAEQVEEPWANCVSISGPTGAQARAYYENLGDKIALFTWSSLAGGFWSGRFTRENRETIRTQGYFEELAVRCYCYEQNFQRYDRAQKLAEERGCSVVQIALAYVMRQPMNIFALVFCADESQFKANNDALSIELTPQQMAWLDLRADSPV